MKKLLIPILLIIICLVGCADNESVSKSGKSITENKIDQLKLPLTKKDNVKETSIKENNQEIISDNEVIIDSQSEDILKKQSEIINDKEPVANTSQVIGEKEEAKPTVKPAEEHTEVIVKNYEIGNCGKLFNSEQEAIKIAEEMMGIYDDGTKYISGYLCYSTYDKWSINYYYSYW